MTSISQSQIWTDLQEHFNSKHASNFNLMHEFSENKARHKDLSLKSPHIFIDYSKSLVTQATLALLEQLANHCSVPAKRELMFAGLPINHTENRAVMHWLLRMPAHSESLLTQWVQEGFAAAQTIEKQNNGLNSLGFSMQTSLEDQKDYVLKQYALSQATLNDFLAYAQDIRSNTQITDVVNIGIGGSDLGPKMVSFALQHGVDENGNPLSSNERNESKRLHFVSNVDGHELNAVLKNLKPANTLFLVASKTFTTLETMTNAHSARQWFLQMGMPESSIAHHFAALTTNTAAAEVFGIERTFGFWDWVGGRYSLWSSIGLSIAIAIGEKAFRQFLAGAHAIDRHFKQTPLLSNAPAVLSLLDVWYRNFYGFTSRCVAPYHSGLEYLSAYLQQLEMESNGKSVDKTGHALAYTTCPVVWGETGTNGQHAFFQLLHQGTDIVPVDFIATAKPTHTLPNHHNQLLANALAQAQALMQGKKDHGGHKNFNGNRPSTFMVLESLTPESLGALIALHEHRTFVSGSIWNINSFDQWGVELGKTLAKRILPCFEAKSEQTQSIEEENAQLDASTIQLLRQLRNLQSLQAI